MNCCETIIKYIVFLFNFVFFLTSVALIGIGAYIQINMTKYLDFLGDSYINTSIILIIIGSLMLIVTFFGCCGACTENHCMMYTYGTMLALILLSLIGVAVTVYIFKDDARKLISANMKDGMQNYNKTGSRGVTDTWDIMQSDFKCCGVDSYKEWFNVTLFSNGDVPDSCCKEIVDGCGKGASPDKIYVTGCLASFENFITGNAAASIGVGVGVIVLLFLGVCVSCCVAKGMAEKHHFTA